MTLFVECYANMVFIGASGGPEPRAGNLVSACGIPDRAPAPAPPLALALHTQEEGLGARGVPVSQCCPARAW